MDWPASPPANPSTPYVSRGDGSPWTSILTWAANFLGLSFLAPLFQSDSLAFNSVKLFLLGSLVETGRRFFRWVYERFDFFQYSITAQFDEGDPVYEWVTLFLTEKKIWKRSRRFHVTARSSRRRWGITMNQNGHSSQSNANNAAAEYVPTYEMAQLFRWNGYWAETRRTFHGSRGSAVYTVPGDQAPGSKKLFLTIYTRNMTALSSFVDDAREMYQTVSQPHVTVHTVEQNGPYHHGMMGNPWLSIKNKARRPLSTIILPHGAVQSLVDDAKEFLSMVDWYSTAGIPHRRGYLLHGPPGTGKTSTIYAIAGELGLEIYSLSLASGYVDDSFLQRAVSSIPNTAILLIEDIDCAFQSREDEEDEAMPAFPGMATGRSTKSGVTLSGLLNVLDGVGSEEGKLFFATTNYLERLDPALLRPGRIDRKIQYKLSTQSQAEALFLRFYPPAYTIVSQASQDVTDAPSDSQTTEKSPTAVVTADKEEKIKTLAAQFASQLPEHEFSIAELQGYLLSCKKEPERAVTDLSAWIEEERKDKEERINRVDERKSKLKDKKDTKEATRLQGSLQKLGILGNGDLNSFGVGNRAAFDKKESLGTDSNVVIPRKRCTCSDSQINPDGHAVGDEATATSVNDTVSDSNSPKLT